MALLKLPGIGTNKPEVEVDKRVEFQVNRNLSENQKISGVIAKVQIRHPAFTVVATVWNRKGRKSVTTPQQESSKGGSWYTLVNLEKNVRDYILYMVEHSEEDNSAWYLDMIGEYTTKITAEDKNSDLGIESIIADGNLTDNQTRAGMLCKVNLVTTIGTIYGYTIWNSKFGQSLFGTSPNEGGQSEDGTRGNPAYRLTREATAQVLAYLHGMVDWTQTREVAPKAEVTPATTQNTTGAPAFEPVDEDESIPE